MHLVVGVGLNILYDMSFWSVLGDAVGAVTSLGGSLINRHSQKETNKSNQRINDANNAFNAEQAELQRKWSVEEAEKARQFDTAERLAQQEWQEKITDPSYQIGRWVDAGLSPANFNGDTSPNGVPSGSSVGVPSGSAAQAGSPIAMHAPVMDVLSMSQSRLLNAQAESLEDDNKRKNDMHEYDIKAAGVNISLAEDELNNMRPAQREKLKKEIDVMQKNIEKLASDIDVNKAYENFYTKEGELKQKEIDSFAERLAQDISESNSRIRLNNQQARECVQRMAESVARIQKMEKEGQLIDAQVKGQIIQNSLNGIEYDVKSAGKDIRIKLQQKEGTSQLELIPFITEREKSRLHSEGLNYDIYTDPLIASLRATSEILGLSTSFSASSSGNKK